MIPGFEFLIASRYLRANRPPGSLGHLRFATLGLVVFTAAVFAGDYLVDYYLRAHLSQVLWDLRSLFRVLKYIGVFFTVVVGFFIELIQRLTIISTITTFGVFLGTGVMITALSVMSGFEQDLKGKILGTHAHMVVTTPDRTFNDYRQALVAVAKTPGVTAVTPYLSSEVMLTSQSNISGVILKGIDPATIGNVTDLVRNIDQGSLDNLLHPDTPTAKEKIDLRPPGRPGRTLQGVVIGRELAKNLRVYVGDEVSVVSPLGDIGPTGPIPKSRPFRVVGIFFSGMYEYDSKYVYMLMGIAQKFLGVEDEVTGLELKLQNPDNTDAVTTSLKPALDQASSAGGFDVDDWKHLNLSLFSALKLEKIAMFIALCFIIVVAVSSIITNGIMLVLEKGQEIAILKSMGASNLGVLRIFVWLGLYMGSLGTSVGMLVGCATCALLDRFGLPLDTDVYYITKLPVKVNPSELLAVLFAGLLLSLGATLYPALLAARLRPVEGLR